MVFNLNGYNSHIAKGRSVACQKLPAAKSKPPRKNLFNDPKVRGWLAQALVLALLAVLVAYALYNIAHNLNKAGITTGFAFLNHPAGFDISQTLIPYTSRSTYADAFIVGILNTLLVSVLGIVCSTILGFFLGIIRLSPNWLISKMAETYTEVIRNIPLLLQILFWYLAILAPLPGPRQAMHFGDIAFLCNRGLQIPKPITGTWIHSNTTGLSGGYHPLHFVVSVE